MAPSRKRRARRTDPLSYLNNVNNPDAQKSPASKAPKRRHTTHRANVYDIPVSSSPEPEPEQESPPEIPGRILRSGLRSQENRRSTEDNHDASSVERQPDKAPESSEDENSEDESNDRIVNEESEELGSDRPHGSLNLFSSDRDSNADRNGSSGSLNPSIQETPPPPLSQSKNQIRSEFEEGFFSQFELSDQDEDQAENSSEDAVQGLLDSQLVDTQLVDTQLVDTQLVGTQLVGTQLVDTQLVDTQLVDQTQNETEIERSYLHELRIWFAHEVEESSLKDEWQTIIRKGKWLRKQALHPMPEILKDPRDIIAELGQIYKQVVATEYLSSDIERGLRNLKDSLFIELVRLRKLAVNSTKKGVTASTIDQFEAYIIPRVITLLLFGFKLYRTLGDTASAQLQDTLFLLIECAQRIKDVAITGLLVKDGGFQNVCAWSQSIRTPLRRILKDLKQKRPVEDSTIGQVNTKPDEVWTKQESGTLIEGLEQYSGESFWLSI
jgi:hypothetical protein